MNNILKKLKDQNVSPEKKAAYKIKSEYACFCIDIWEAKKAGYKNSQITDALGVSYSQASTASAMITRSREIYREAKKRGLLREIGFESD